MLKKITLNCGEYGKWRAWAWVDGNFAIHKTITLDGYSRRFWTLTHEPSGVAIFACLDREDVPDAIQQAKNIKVGNASYFDMPTCEIIDIAVIVIEKREGKERAADWLLNEKQDFERYVGC